MPGLEHERNLQEFQKVAGLALQNALANHRKSDIFGTTFPTSEDDYPGYKANMYSLEFCELLELAILAYRSKNGHDHWQNKMKAQLQRYEEEIPMEERSSMYLNYYLYLVEIGATDKAEEILSTLGEISTDEKQLALGAHAKYLVEKGEDQQAELLMKQVDLPYPIYDLYRQLVPLYIKHDRKKDLYALARKIEDAIPLIGSIADPESPMVTTFNSLLEKVKLYLDGIEVKSTEQENNERLLQLEDLVLDENYEAASTMAREILEQLESQRSISPLPVHKMALVIGTALRNRENHQYIQNFLDEEKFGMGAVESFAIWANLHNEEMLERQYGISMLDMPRQADFLERNYVIALFEIEPTRSLEKMKTLRTPKLRFCAMTSLISTYADQGRILSKWQKYLAGAAELSAQSDIVLSNNEEKIYSVSACLRDVGIAAVKNSDWGTLETVLKDTRLNLNEFSELAEEMNKIF